MKTVRTRAGAGPVCNHFNALQRGGRRSKAALSGRQELAFTMIEVLLVVAIVGVLMGIALPVYQQMQTAGNGASAQGDIEEISRAIDDFYFEYNRYPDSLADIGRDGMLDPWGNPYRYTPITIQQSKGKSKSKTKTKTKDKVRKDKNLHPINTDYDLYSMGPDGKSVFPLTAGPSRDDIIRASNGSFVGVAADY